MKTPGGKQSIGSRGSKAEVKSPGVREIVTPYGHRPSVKSKKSDEKKAQFDNSVANLPTPGFVNDQSKDHVHRPLDQSDISLVKKFDEQKASHIDILEVDDNRLPSGNNTWNKHKEGTGLELGLS